MANIAVQGSDIGGFASLAGPLENLYEQYNHARFVSPDPLQCLAGYGDVADREIVGLVASGLAFGNVQTILRSTEAVLEKLPRPARFLDRVTRRRLDNLFDGFRHRYVTGVDVVNMLWGIKQARARHGSLEGLFAACLDPREETILGALARFACALRCGRTNYLLPEVEKGSACKRLHLFLRWMVRQDEVDPGGWSCIAPSQLLMPMDTHSHRIARQLGLTRRNAADARAMLEVTAAFRQLRPDDPVRYDFCITRLGIRTDSDLAAFLHACRLAGAQAA
jgi:uncharacterized protein (TIGR02757 family)